MSNAEDARWPSYDELVGMLYELATGLFGSAENPYPAFDVMDRGLIESAIGLPHLPYYQTFQDRLAAMVRSIAVNHGLRDGNKRLALTVLHSTLIVNGFVYLWNDDEAEALVLRCASGDSDFRWLAEFIETWAVSVPVGDDFDLEFTDPDAFQDLIEWLRDSMAAKLSEVPHLDSLHSVITQHAEGTLPSNTRARLRAARQAWESTRLTD